MIFYISSIFESAVSRIFLFKIKVLTDQLHKFGFRLSFKGYGFTAGQAEKLYIVDAGKSRTKIYSVQKIDQIGYMDYRYYKLF